MSWLRQVVLAVVSGAKSCWCVVWHVWLVKSTCSSGLLCGWAVRIQAGGGRAWSGNVGAGSGVVAQWAQGCGWKEPHPKYSCSLI